MTCFLTNDDLLQGHVDGQRVRSSTFDTCMDTLYLLLSFESRSWLHQFETWEWKQRHTTMAAWCYGWSFCCCQRALASLWYKCVRLLLPFCFFSTNLIIGHHIYDTHLRSTTNSSKATATITEITSKSSNGQFHDEAWVVRIRLIINRMKNYLV